MLSPERLTEIQKRLESVTGAESPERQDLGALLGEVRQLQSFAGEFSRGIHAQVSGLEADMIRLDEENARLRGVAESTYFERDACIGLIARMAVALGFHAGRGQFAFTEIGSRGEAISGVQNRVIIDLPSGQVSWDYLDAEAHLFDWLPPYERPLHDQSVQENYTKVMNPGV